MDIIKRSLEMKEEKLFIERKLVGNNVLSMMKDKGYTKSSLSKIVNISRPTLDKLINGEIDNKTTFISHITKIIDKGIAKYEDFLDYRRLSNDDGIVTLYSDNAPIEYVRNNDTNESFMMLDDLINLSELYK
ncbi:helix-turn-helix transcriptional regulator [Clostridium gasigenes]|uniref:helix-turn-helix domain-containing protein n=1 Tax=Clostridium gasigenes TaxID=94869 RepID=UPI001C0D1828|nr:helix-turn-helix transcriptional regulator [Clostridium gasigenes]MBU3137836.1 helix-turn-helix transcriptional regulator [Clostridium gasigenes]